MSREDRYAAWIHALSLMWEDPKLLEMKVGIPESPATDFQKTLYKFLDKDDPRIEFNEMKAVVELLLELYKVMKFPSAELVEKLMDDGRFSINDIRQMLGLGPVYDGAIRKSKPDKEANWLVPREIINDPDCQVYDGECSNCGYVKTGPSQFFPPFCPGCKSRMLPAILYKPLARNANWMHRDGRSTNPDKRIGDATCSWCGHHPNTVFESADQLPKVCPACKSTMGSIEI